jgi:PhnB protein
MAQINSYLNFNDNCREAMTFYKNCLGGELFLQTVGESPMAGVMPSDMKDAILHSSLTSGEMVIMGSDMKRDRLVDGNTVHMCINCKTDEEIRIFFEGLAAGGKIIEAIHDMPWGAKFGALIDKYGKHWTFSYDKNQHNNN